MNFVIRQSKHFSLIKFPGILCRKHWCWWYPGLSRTRRTSLSEIAIKENS